MTRRQTRLLVRPTRRNHNQRAWFTRKVTAQSNFAKMQGKTGWMQEAAQSGQDGQETQETPEKRGFSGVSEMLKGCPAWIRTKKT